MLATQEETMRWLQSILARSGIRPSGCDNMTDGESRAMSKSNAKSATEEVLRDLLLKTRYLLFDVHNMDQAAQLMGDVRVLGTSLRVGKGEIEGNCTDCDDIVDRRK